MSLTPNGRIHRIHQELGDIVDDPSVAAHLPQALLDRLKAMRGMLLEEMNTNPEANSRMAMRIPPN
jgi:hypothetical protein